MNEIILDEQKKILVELLTFLDKVCRENKIKYTLVGGSMIGAIRHKGFIPWDDDIDVGLRFDEYDKLFHILKNMKNEKYELLYFGCNKSYFYPFMKIIDKRTCIEEIECKKIDNYGVYLDIFKYNNMPKSRFMKKYYYKKVIFYKKLITGYGLNEECKRKQKNILKKIRNNVSKKLGIEFIVKKYIDISEKNNTNKSENLMLSWPAYGFSHEVLNSFDIIDYIDCDFEGNKSMIIRNYDSVLKTIFGDYMQLPPVEKRISNHSMKVYWK